MSTEQNTDVQTNGHDHGSTNGKPLRPSPAYQWLPAADLPDHLSGAVIPTPPTEEVDETPIWGDEAPDPDALEKAVDRARRTVQLQNDDALRLAKTPSDIAADLDAERVKRDLRRELDLERSKAAIKAARDTADHERDMRRLRMQAAARVARSRERAQQAADPSTDVVRLDRGRWIAPAIAMVPGVLAIIGGAINVGSELTRLFPHTPVVPWIVEPVLTLGIVAIMYMQWIGAAPTVTSGAKSRSPYVLAEVVLFVLTAGLAVGLHYVPGPDGQATSSGALFWLVIPVGLAMSMYLVPKLRADATERFLAAAERADEVLRKLADEAWDELRPTPSDLHGTNSGEGAGTNANEGSGTNANALVPDPDRESLDSIRARLRALVEAGEVDPNTVSVNAARGALGVRRERAEEALIAEYGRPDLVERRRRREARKSSR